MKNPVENLYRKEVSERINAIESAIYRIDKNGHFESEIRKIVGGCMQIMDLGMIHGYDGVEAIAERMFATARLCAYNGSESLDSTKNRLIDAINTLRQVVDVSEETSARAIISNATSKMDFQIDDVPEIYADDSDEIMSEPLRPRSKITHSEQKALFEIKEFTAIPKAKVKKKGNDKPSLFKKFDEYEAAYELDKNAPEYIDEEEFEDFMQAFEEGEIKIIESTLNEISSQKAFSELEKLIAATEKIKVEKDIPLSILDIQSACKSLKEISEEMSLQPIAEIIYPMERIARENLSEDRVDEEAISILDECGELVREFIKNREIPLKRIMKSRSRLNNYFFERNTTIPKEVNFDINSGEIDAEALAAELKIPFFARVRKILGLY